MRPLWTFIPSAHAYALTRNGVTVHVYKVSGGWRVLGGRTWPELGLAKREGGEDE